MKLSCVVAHLRQFCPSLAERVAVALEFDPDRGQVRMTVPAAVVMPSDDDAEPSVAYSQNVSIQSVTDRFAVVLVTTTADPQRGDVTADVLHALRAEVWRALIGWRPSEGYEPIQYVGGELTTMNRSMTCYMLTFSAEYTVGSANGVPPGVVPETWQEYELAKLPELKSLGFGVDVIDPIADPNLKAPGPDGRIEFDLSEDALK